MSIRMMAVCAAIFLVSATDAAFADSGHARDRDGQMTQPSAEAREKTQKQWAAKLDILRLEAAIRSILEQENGRTTRRIIELPASSPGKPGS
jgi:hypothetical protein